jgi:hypothetical protein
MSRINSKQAARRETIAYLNGLQEGIRVATAIWRDGVTISLDEVLKPYKARVDRLNASIEEGAE